MRVYEWTLGSWTQLGNDIDGEAADDRSGGSVALSSDGHTLAVGAFWNDEAYHEAGHVRVYAWDSSSWTQLGDDIDGKATQEFIGSSVALSAAARVVATGAMRSQGYTGLMRVYEATQPL